jgi:hypothetical protein
MNAAALAIIPDTNIAKAANKLVSPVFGVAGASGVEAAGAAGVVGVAGEGATGVAEAFLYT